MSSTTDPAALRVRAHRLGLNGLIARFDEFAHEPWLPVLIDIEEHERGRRSQENRLRCARIGRFKPIVDFDWTWPKKIDREATEELFSLDFINEAANVILVGPNGTGKTMIAQNIAHQAVLRGYTCRFITASALLNDLAACDSATALSRRLKLYCSPRLLCVDEVGYLSYHHRHADLLFEVVSRRYGKGSIVLATNKPFAEWNEVFPNASCVVTLVDRLVHKAELLQIDADSFRLREARERAARKASERARRKQS